MSDAMAAPGGRIQGRVSILNTEGVQLEDQANVVVFLEGVPKSATGLTSELAPRVSHLGRQFNPRVLPIVAGGQVDFFNDDTIYHNVFSVSRTKPFDLGIYPEGTSKLVSFDQPGLVKLYCNIHPKMVSNILVLNNPFFAVTDSHGNYAIDDVPAGSFRLRFWHEFSTEKSAQIDIVANATSEFNIELLASKRLKQHKNKFGKSYRSKY